MSFVTAIGQIDQILEWQDQVLDPAAATDGTSSTSGTDSADTASSLNDSAFAAALAEAQGSTADEAAGADSSDSDSSLTSLLDGGGSQLLSLLNGTSGTDAGSTASSTTSASDSGGVAASSATDPRITAMVEKANSLLGDPYVWGGGHSGWGAQSGYDCSGFVSAVLHAGGYLSSPQDTETLPSASGIESGAGKYVTIYDRNEAGQEGHVIIDIDGQFYESGGEHGSWGGGGGVEKIDRPSAAYLATFNDILHPAGL